MSRRAAPAQKPPPDPEALRAGMPRSTVQGAWHREHADRPGPEHAMALFGAAGAAPDLHPVVSQYLAAVVADLGFRTVSPPSPLQLSVTSAPPSDEETGGPGRSRPDFVRAGESV